MHDQPATHVQPARYRRDDDDLRLWRPGDICVTTASYAVHDALDTRWYDESGIDREQVVCVGERYPAVGMTGLYWRYADLARHQRGRAT